ncbi:unnamed protein product [Phaedon cochleariae]|uniref:FYVE-type domain-containing protein n=1 Tax=Phaedon cochleariae TaxID=80249 RepID=A0A9N9X3K5_PHACE|nr:unnamed protein product [Phaedon cochleariae]
MDKFAVDLDQVLNDFEYSEFTDQYNATRNTSASTQNNGTMHSINNVFHSLNEYLNTNIDITSPSQTQKMPEKDTVNIPQHSEKCSTEPGSKITEKIDLNENDLHVQKHNGTGDFANIQIINVEQAENIKNINKELLDETETVSPEYYVNHGNKEDIEKESISNEEHILHTFDNSIDEREPNSDQSIKHNTESEIVVVPDSNKKGTEVVEDIGVEIIHFEVKDSVAEAEVGKNDHDTAKQENSDDSVEACNTVGFVDDLNLDDTAINQLLAELEDEFKDTDEKSDVHCNEKDHVETVILEKTTEVMEDLNQSIPIHDVIGKEIINNADDSVSATGTSDKEDFIIDNKIIENTSSTDPQPSPYKTTVGTNDEETGYDVTTNDEDTKTDMATMKQTDHGVGDSSGTNEVENANSVADSDNNSSGPQEIEGSCDSSSRPQNLSLKENDGDSQREINLIGNPGSTPYNNIYVREEIHKHGTHNHHHRHHESDASSSSSSDTFSDASSTASTASTEEATDEREPNVADGKPNVDDGKPNVNDGVPDVDDGARSAADARKAIVGVGDANDEAGDASGRSDEVQLSGDEDGENVGEQDADRAENSDVPPESEEITEDPESESVTLTCSGDYPLDDVGTQWLGKRAPHWIPDADATSCLHCDMKFTVLKRRHHCRACGLVLCSKCCHLRFKLDYLDAEARVCNKCHGILNRDSGSSSGSERSPENGNSPQHRPNPNNPSEYCSTVSPLEQAAGGNANPPAVMVPVGVLKRKGSNKGKSNKSVMFCDGIRPGSDLTNLDNDFNYNNTKTKKLEKNNTSAGKINRNLPIIDSETNTFIPKNENSLPPIVTISKTDITYADCSNNPATIEMLKNEEVTFALQLSLYVHLKVIDMSCCINKMAWCFSTEGLINVGQDEIVYLLEYIDEESFVPKDVFYHINNIYVDAVKGTSVKELGLSLHNSTNFLDSKNHAGFVYIRPSFQCLENVIKPNDPFLIGILIHRWETPWAKLFPLRLILRLGAEYRYYPSPIISSRHRDSVFVEVGHTIINLLADFRNYSYSLPQIRGLTIHMEDKNTTVTIPMNRYDQVVKSLNNTSDHILAFAGTFSQLADSHLVCIQDTQGNDNSYSTHAINIHNKPRKITGASFIVFNGALKSSSGLTAKSNIVEDGLMIQVLPEHMQQIRDKLRAMKNHTISCGCVNAESDETVNIVWGENDANFNIGVSSTIDNMSLSGIPSIRVHNGKNHVCVNGNRIIRWTEVFIIQNGEENAKNQEPVDISRLSENIAKATCDALVKYLDLLLTNNFQKIGIRTTLQSDNVSYCAGSNGVKLPPIYMKSLDEELIPVLHRLTSSNLSENAIILELIFRILNV